MTQLDKIVQSAPAAMTADEREASLRALSRVNAGAAPPFEVTTRTGVRYLVHELTQRVDADGDLHVSVKMDRLVTVTELVLEYKVEGGT